MGAVLAIPLLGSMAGIAGTLVSSALAGLAFFCTSQAAAAFCKSCNCSSSIATRIGYSIIFLLNSMVAWIMLTPWAIHKIESLSYDYIKMSCSGGKCYGVLAVHRICFALALLHTILSLLLIGVRDTRTKRAAIQNGWWGPKVLSWILLIVMSFAIPNGFFMFWSKYIAVFGSGVFILIGLVLLVDFVHTWSETCIDKWEQDDSQLWKYILVGSTLAEYGGVIALTTVDYIFFGTSGCGLNQFFITFNIILCVLATFLSVLPAVQEANPRSGLAQSGMVGIYTTYLVTSAVANHEDKSGQCNPLSRKANAARSSMVILGAIFTFLAIAYSTSRAATSSKAFSGKKGSKSSNGAIRLPSDDLEGELDTVITKQPTKQDSLRIQALMAAVEAGSLPASALEEVSDDEDEVDEGAPGANDRDDERSGTRYNYSWFHVIFCLAAMYVSMLLTDWNVVIPMDGGDDQGDYVRIGRSGVAMWMRIVSSWICLTLYMWSLIAPVVMPDRFG